MARKRRIDRLSLFYAVVIFGLLVGGSIWLDTRGESVVARVAGKTEEIIVTHEPQGGWHRFYRVGAEFDAGGAPMSATVTLDRARYDGLRLGDSIEIRYLPMLPLYARTSDRSTATVAAEAALQLPGSRLVWWILGGALAMVIAARIGMAVVAVTGLFWMAVGYLLLLQAPSVPTTATVETNARVRGVTTVAKSPSRRTGRRRSRAFRSQSVTRLEVPYQVVQLQVPIHGRPDSLLAVDAVDSGSVAGLTAGAVLRVSYPEDDPRAALLTDGARTFLTRNRYHYLPIVIGLPLIGILAAWGFRSRRRRTPTQSGARAPGQGVATTMLVIASIGLSGIAAPHARHRATVLPSHHPTAFPFFCRGGEPLDFAPLPAGWR